MKNFFKIVFGTFLALVLFAVCVALLGIATVVGITKIYTNKKEPTVTIEKGSYLVVNMSVNITDTPPPSDLERSIGRVFGGGDGDSVSLRSLLGAINAAKTDSRIAGIFLTGSFEPQGYGSGFAALKEVREALQSFRDTPAHKPVTAYLVSPSKRDYYLASAASQVYLNPFGEMDFAGFASEPTFYKGALDKYGIGVQVTRVGKYKSYVEPFILQKMSPENREQTSKLLGDLWTEFKAGVEQDRKIPADQLQALADQNGLVNAETAKQSGLVNELAYLPDVLEKLRAQTGDAEDTLADRHTFKQVDLTTYIKQTVGKPQTTEITLANLANKSPRLAVVYAEGRHRGRRGRGQRLRRRRPFRPCVAAAAQRSERQGHRPARQQPRRQRAGQRGDPARAGPYPRGGQAGRREHGYSRSLGRILHQHGGGQGVRRAEYHHRVHRRFRHFAQHPRHRQQQRHHLRRREDGQICRPVHGVAPEDSRGVERDPDAGRPVLQPVQGPGGHRAQADAVEQVEEIAQGRVWSGEEALKIGLVDELGGLDKALDFAKGKAGLKSDAKIVEYPAPKELAETLTELISGDKKPLASSHLLRIGAHSGPLAQQIEQMQEDLEALGHFNDPSGVYARLPFDLRVK